MSEAVVDGAVPALATLPSSAARQHRQARLGVKVRSPRAQARRLLALRGVNGEDQFRALATLWALAVSGRGEPVSVDADAMGERLGLPGTAVTAAVDDLVRADLLQPDDTQGNRRMRLRPLEGLDEAVANLSRLMLPTG